jgi:hypothetical protein
MLILRAIPVIVTPYATLVRTEWKPTNPNYTLYRHSYDRMVLLVTFVTGQILFRRFQVAFSEIKTLRDGFVFIFVNNIRTGMRQYFLYQISEITSVRQSFIHFFGNTLRYGTVPYKASGEPVPYRWDHQESHVIEKKSGSGGVRVLPRKAWAIRFDPTVGVPENYPPKNIKPQGRSPPT